MSSRLPVRYHEGGSPLISVTQILTFANRIDAQWFTAEACARGSLVHSLTEQFDLGLEIEIPEHVRGYMDAYFEFLAVVNPTYVDVEARVRNTQRALAGTIDRICADLFGDPAIIDLKTGQKAQWHGQQLAAYNFLRPTGARYCVYLRPNGKPKVVAYDDPIDHLRFMDDLEKVQAQVQVVDEHWRIAA